jgi:DNA-binding transcriptional ArsR family regulator
VLTIMLETEELNISEIMRRSHLSHSATARHLEYLKRSGILTEKRFNRIRIFRIDNGSPMVGVLTRFYTDWKETEGAFPTRSYN